MATFKNRQSANENPLIEFLKFGKDKKQSASFTHKPTSHIHEYYLVGEIGIVLDWVWDSDGICVGSDELAGTVSWFICVDSTIITEFATKFVDWIMEPEAGVGSPIIIWSLIRTYTGLLLITIPKRLAVL